MIPKNLFKMKTYFAFGPARGTTDKDESKLCRLLDALLHCCISLVPLSFGTLKFVFSLSSFMPCKSELSQSYMFDRSHQ